MSEIETIVDFRKSAEFARRLMLRQAINKSQMTRSQKAIVTALLNLWLHHRNGKHGYIHPGREKIAKTVRASVRTVARAFKELRVGGVLIVHGRPNGEGQSPTEYTMDLVALLLFCGAKIPKWAEGTLVPITPSEDIENEKRSANWHAKEVCQCHARPGQKWHTVLSDASIGFPQPENNADGGHDE